MPPDDLEQYLAGFQPLPPGPLPEPVRRARWLVPLALAAALALALVFWAMPRSPQSPQAPETPFTLGRASALVAAGTPWKVALDEAAFASRLARRGTLEFLTQEEPAP